MIYNAAEAALPVVLPENAQVLMEGCAPTNGFIDAGETVTVNFGLHNVGAASTTNLTATLLATNGVRNPSGPQTYGAVTTNGASVLQSLHLPGRSRLRNCFASHSYASSTAQMITEQFPSPSSWERQRTCSRKCSMARTLPIFPINGAALRAGHSTHGPPPRTPATQRLTPHSRRCQRRWGCGVGKPAINIKSAGAQLSFSHNYSLEAGYDGGVLEIKMGTNDYVDILAAGGSFETGGYDRILLTGNGSDPLKGRSAWSGTSAGFMETVVNLPASAAGQTVQLKWRCGTDTSNGGQGWYVDDVTVTDYHCCGNLMPAQAAFTASPLASGPPPVSITFTDLSTGTITDRIWNFGNGITTNTTATNFSIIYTNAGTNKVTLTVDGPAGGSTLTRTNYIIVTNLAPVIASNALTLLTESCTNGVIDPGETVTVEFGLKNIGGGAATNLTATLLVGGGYQRQAVPKITDS